MACNSSLTSILKGCENNIGGVKAIYIAPQEQVTGITTDNNGTVTGITMSGSANFAQYDFNKNSASYVEEAAIDLTNGSTFFTTTTTLTIPRREVAKRNSIALLAAGQRPLYIIIVDNNDNVWLQGFSNNSSLGNYANLTGVGEGSGVAKADGSKYTLTFISEEPEMMHEVDSSIIANLLS